MLVEDHPPAKLYRLNRRHLAAGGVIALSHLRSSLLAGLREHLGRWGAPPTAA